MRMPLSIKKFYFIFKSIAWIIRFKLTTVYFIQTKTCVRCTHNTSNLFDVSYSEHVNIARSLLNISDNNYFIPCIRQKVCGVVFALTLLLT